MWLYLDPVVFAHQTLPHTHTRYDRRWIFYNINLVQCITTTIPYGTLKHIKSIQKMCIQGLRDLTSRIAQMRAHPNTHSYLSLDSVSNIHALGVIDEQFFHIYIYLTAIQIHNVYSVEYL